MKNMRNLLMKNMFGDGDDDLEELDWEQGRSSFAVTDLCNQITVSNTLWPTMNVMMMMWFKIYAFLLIYLHHSKDLLFLNSSYKKKQPLAIIVYYGL